MRRLLPAPAQDVDADALYDLYALPPAPHVRGGFVLSVDGAVAVEGSSRPLSDDADRAALRTLRAVADVVLVGAGTARSEDYGRIPLPEPLRRRRLDEGRAERPPLAVVTRTGRLPERLREEPWLLLVTTDDAPVPDGVDALRCGADVDLRRALALLGERGLHRVHCEGGPELLRALLAEDLVDELCLTTSPQVVGAGPRLLDGDAHRRLHLVHLLEQDGTLLARWSLR